MTLSASPSAPLPGETVTLSTDVSDGVCKCYLVSVPDGSSLTPGVLVDASGANISTFEPDVPGDYAFTVSEFRRYNVPPSYPGDPIGEARDKLVSTASITVTASDTLDLPIRTTLGHQVTLRIVVPGSGAVTASLVNPTTDIAKSAALDSTVLAALAGMTNPGSTIGGNFISEVYTLGQKVILHFATTTGSPPVHASTDTVDTLYREPPQDVPSAIATLNDIRAKLAGERSSHFIQGQGGATFHGIDDTFNSPIIGPASTLPGAIVLYADLAERCYERHRVTVSSVHGSADNTNALAAPSQLTSAIVAWLDVVALLSPTVPTGENDEAFLAVHKFGFVAAP